MGEGGIREKIGVGEEVVKPGENKRRKIEREMAVASKTLNEL